MPESIHGHAVLKILLAAQSPITLPELSDVASRQFGSNVCYHTCSAFDLTLDQLIDMFVARRKITIEGGALVVHREEVCTNL
jgi:probable metal-binding protein